MPSNLRISLIGRLLQYLVHGFTFPFLLGFALWILIPFLADKNPNSGYEGISAAFDTVRVAPLLFVGMLFNLWMMLIPPNSGKWLFVIGALPIIASWLYAIHLVSDAGRGITNLDLLMRTR